MFDRKAVYAVFNAADESSTSYAEKLAALGVDQPAARAMSLEWASEKYRAPLRMGQRGMTLPRDSAAAKAAQRVMSIIYPRGSEGDGKAGKRNAVDPVEKLIRQCLKLTAAQRRRIKAAI
jgi:hypothetical protein